MQFPRLKDMLREAWVAQEQDREDRQKFIKTVCQCCGYARYKDSDPECVCDGTKWYLEKDGRVECEPHRFARAIGQGRKSFPGFSWKR